MKKYSIKRNESVQTGYVIFFFPQLPNILKSLKALTQQERNPVHTMLLSGRRGQP